MTAPNPEEVMTQDGYDDWLDKKVEMEVREFLEFHEEPFHIDQIQVWLDESPILADNDWSWARLYDQVKNNSYNLIPSTDISVPSEDPWYKLSLVVRTTVMSDLCNRMAIHLEDDGYEVER